MNKLIKQIFLKYVRNLNMIGKENSKYPPNNLIKDIKNEKLEEKLLNVLNLIDEIGDKKINDFEESVKKFNNDKSYKLTDFYQKDTLFLKLFMKKMKD